MTPERMARLVAGWVRLYTRGLPNEIAERRAEEIDVDLHDHITYERAHGTGDRRLAAGVLSRMVRGLAADVSWRRTVREGTMLTTKTAYRAAVALTILAPLFLLWLMGAVGVIGIEGDRADLMYLGVLAIGVIGAVIARFRPEGMARTLIAMALAQALVAVVALILGSRTPPTPRSPSFSG